MTELPVFYERNLPHIQPPGATLFLTYRLVDSIPAYVLREIQAEAQLAARLVAQLPDTRKSAETANRERIRLFGKWDAALDSAATGPQWLKDPQAAKTVTDSLHFLDGGTIDIDSFCIMFNHVHVIFTPRMDPKTGEYHALRKIMQSHKGYTARKCNQLLQRKGQFWQHESFDHYVRDTAELDRIRRYVILNPVRAGLVENWDEWPWTYRKFVASCFPACA
ncbi:MAG: transposase [Candidatus Promineifilaceae bacterium]|nr:transposase [Candidatus Promineifilaceae bacterium]